MYKLLIVDDEQSILQGILHTLDWMQYGFGRIETADRYDEAVIKAVELQPDIAIFDVCIGTTKGYDLINRLNALELKTKYIMMSGYEEFEYVREAMRCGAKDYLLKPVDAVRLRQVVEHIIIDDLHGTIQDAQPDSTNIDPILKVRYDTLSNLTNKILLIVREEYNEDLSLRSVADKFKMNATYLGQIFLKDAKLKFSEYLMLYRLFAAQNMILRTDEKISYIARSVGYANLNYFYAHFRDCFGMSPSEMREKGWNRAE